MCRFWIGTVEGTMFGAGARYSDGRVWIGSVEGTSFDAAARYSDGRVWMGSVEGTSFDAAARYSDGRLWIGNVEGTTFGADARYSDGRVWMGSVEGTSFDSAARYDGPEDGAAAAAFLLLLGGYEGEFDDVGQAEPAGEDDAEEPDHEEGNCSAYEGSITSSSAPLTGREIAIFCGALAGVPLGLAALSLVGCWIIGYPYPPYLPSQLQHPPGWIGNALAGVTQFSFVWWLLKLIGVLGLIAWVVLMLLLFCVSVPVLLVAAVITGIFKILMYFAHHLF